MADSKHPAPEEALTPEQADRLAEVGEAGACLAAANRGRRAASDSLTEALETACVFAGVSRYKAAKATRLSWPAVAQRLQRAGWRYVPDPSGGEGVLVRAGAASGGGGGGW